MSVQDHIIHMENGILHADSSRPKVDSMVASALSGGGPIVVHFHGGLVKYKVGVDGAKRLLPIYEQAGGFPVFFVWESGLLETIENNLGEISQEKIFKIVWKRVRRIVERKSMQVISGRSIGDLPQPDDDQFEQDIDNAVTPEDVATLMRELLDGEEHLTELSEDEQRTLEEELEFDAELDAEVKNISLSLRDPADVDAELNSRSFTVRGATTTLMDPSALDEFIDRPTPTSRGLISTIKIIKAIVKIAAKVILRFVRSRDHGLHATIVEEILHALYVGNVGGLVWRTMKKDTADSFGQDPQKHAGTAFIDSLKNQADASNLPRIILIGHSTGAVYISEFLKHADAQLGPSFKFDVVFLAPASTFDLTAETLANFSHRISDFRMFTMTDANEKKDRLVPILYPHSLLYFVSGVVETDRDMPIVGMQRYYYKSDYTDNRFSSVAAVRNFVTSASDRSIWSVTTNQDPGKNTAALKHGDFDNESATMASISHIIGSGY